MRTMTDPRCGKVSRANDTDGHCTKCHRTWAGESAFTAHQHINDGVLTCEDPETDTKPNGERKWWPRERPGTTDGVAWGLGEPGWAGLRGTVVPVEADTAEPLDAIDLVGALRAAVNRARERRLGEHSSNPREDR